MSGFTTNEGNEWEVLSVGYQALSGKAYHMSDCATCCAPAYKPLPCDCDAPAAQQASMLETLERIGGIDEEVLAWAFAKRFRNDPDRGYGKISGPKKQMYTSFNGSTVRELWLWADGAARGVTLRQLQWVHSSRTVVMGGIR